MNAYILSPQSEVDIFEIWTYLAQETSLDFADQSKLTYSKTSSALRRLQAWDIGVKI